MDSIYYGTLDDSFNRCCPVAYAGVEETMRFFAYIDLQFRYAWIRFSMEMMRRKLEETVKDLLYNKLIKETTMTDDPDSLLKWTALNAKNVARYG